MVHHIAKIEKICPHNLDFWKMHSWSFRKHKGKYITDNEIDMKFGPDVINSAANSWKI